MYPMCKDLLWLHVAALSAEAELLPLLKALRAAGAKILPEIWPTESAFYASGTTR